jgi:hypothetical protein
MHAKTASTANNVQKMEVNAAFANERSRQGSWDANIFNGFASHNSELLGLLSVPRAKSFISAISHKSRYMTLNFDF